MPALFTRPASAAVAESRRGAARSGRRRSRRASPSASRPRRALGVLVLAHARHDVEPEFAQVARGGLADSGGRPGDQHRSPACSPFGCKSRPTYPVASKRWISKTRDPHPAHAQGVRRRSVRGGRSTSCSSWPAGRRTTTSRTPGASVSSARRRWSALRRPPVPEAGREARPRPHARGGLGDAVAATRSRTRRTSAPPPWPPTSCSSAAHGRGLAGYWRTPAVLATSPRGPRRRCGVPEYPARLLASCISDPRARRRSRRRGSAPVTS